MPTKISERASEGSSFTLLVEFYEKKSDGTLTPVVPNSGLTYSLKDGDGGVVNGKGAESIDPPAQAVYIVLSGNDLKTFSGKTKRRYVTVKGTYNGLAGNNLPLVEEASFQIDNLIGE